MNKLQKTSLFILLFIFSLLFINICFELLEKKVIITSIMGGIIIGGIISYFNTKNND